MLVLDLIQNIAILLALTVAYDQIIDRWPPRSFSSRVIQGFLFGGIAIIGMMTPVRFAPGILYDGRTVVLAAAGFIGGPLVAAIAALGAAIYRGILGGSGAVVGVLSIIEAAGLGAVAYELRRRDRRWERVPAQIGLGILVHVLMLLFQLLLPDRIGFTVLLRFGPAILVFYPAALTLILTIFLRHEERRYVLRQLREKEEQYRALFDNRHSPMLVIDPADASIVDANRAATDFYGWSREELRGMHAMDLNTLPRETILAEMERARRSEVNRWEFQHRRKDGSIRDVAIRSGQVEIGGKVRLYSIIEDITEQKQQARDLFLASHSIEQSAVPVYRIDEANARIVYANRKACDSLGYTRDELTAMTLFDIDPNANLADWREHRGINYSTTPRTLETTHRRKDGSTFPVEVTVAYFTYEGTDYSVTFARDLTERKNFERQISESLDEKKVLLQEIHHRVRNNLVVINGLMSLQTKDLANSDASFTAIEKTRDRIAVMGMIHDMLYQSKDLAKIDFSAFLRQITAQLQATYFQDGVSLSVEAESLFLEVTDAVPLGILANEAITNALKHAFPDHRTGSVVIDLTARGGGFDLRIVDDGVGIASDDVASLGMELMESLAHQIAAVLVIDTDGTAGCLVSVSK